MRILWITNMVLPKVAKELNLKTSVSGGWLSDYANKLAHNFNDFFGSSELVNENG